MKIKTFYKTGIVLLQLLFTLAAVSPIRAADDNMLDLGDMSLEDLMNIEITSVSKKPEKVSEAAAAVFVISQEDIRRSGATSIPEALRMAPGIQVARITANKWAITARGFNDRFSNKLLVLMDGRTLYTPLFSGVFWEAQDTMMEDIDRIEVIRGPGATLWGSNAVNGVINIITKSARDTQGGLVTLGAGTEERGFGGVRYGGTNEDGLYYRVYAKYFNRDDSVYPSGDHDHDSWDMGQTGFRLDWDYSECDLLTLQGDLYDGEVTERITMPTASFPYGEETNTDGDLTGANVIGRWSRLFSDSSDMSIQVYFDWYQREHESLYEEDRYTFDIDFQHRFRWKKHNELLWGTGYRFTVDDVENLEVLTMDPDSETDHLFNGFLQDEITLRENELYLTLGSKVEHNDDTGYEIQPSVRLLWTPDKRHSLWTAVSRAVRTPSRAENDISIPFTTIAPGVWPNPTSLPVIAVANGSSDFDSEELVAYELGYRLRAADNLSFDIALFYHDYDKLLTGEIAGLELVTSPPPTHLLVEAQGDNKMYGETYGVEAVCEYYPFRWWKLQFIYSFLRVQLHLESDSTDVWFEEIEGMSPRNQASVRSEIDVTEDVEVDLGLRYVDRLSATNIPSYLVLDARIGWRPWDNIEFSVVGQNLFDDRHPEFGDTAFINMIPTEVEHSVYGKVTVRF